MIWLIEEEVCRVSNCDDRRYVYMEERKMQRSKIEDSVSDGIDGYLVRRNLI